MLIEVLINSSKTIYLYINDFIKILFLLLQYFNKYLLSKY